MKLANPKVYTVTKIDGVYGWESSRTGTLEDLVAAYRHLLEHGHRKDSRVMVNPRTARQLIKSLKKANHACRLFRVDGSVIQDRFTLHKA